MQPPSCLAEPASLSPATKRRRLEQCAAVPHLLARQPPAPYWTPNAPAAAHPPSVAGYPLGAVSAENILVNGQRDRGYGAGPQAFRSPQGAGSSPRELAAKHAERVLEDLAVLGHQLGQLDPQLLAASDLATALALVSRIAASLRSPPPAARPLAQSEDRPRLAPRGPPDVGARLAAASQRTSHGALVASSESASGSLVPGGSDASLAPFRLADFAICAVLGKGAFGVVRLALHKASGRAFSVKVLSKELIVRNKQQEHVKNEMWALGQTRHPFIVRLHATFQDANAVYFLMENVPGGDLFDFIRRASRLSNALARFFAAELVLAVGYLHGLHILHRDLKPENVLLDARGHLKLADFGFAKFVQQRTLSTCGTLAYAAPEVILEHPYGAEVDWWSLGVLVFEMLAGRAPFREDHERGVHEYILASRPDYPPDLDPQARHFIQSLLQPNPAHRLGHGLEGTEAIKAHPWFAPLNWEVLLQQANTPRPALEGHPQAHVGAPFESDEDPFTGF